MLIHLTGLRVVDLVDAAVDVAELTVDPLLAEHNVTAEVVDFRDGLVAEDVGDDLLPDLTDGPLDRCHVWTATVLIGLSGQFFGLQRLVELDLECG